MEGDCTPDMIVIGVCGHVLVMCWSCACHVSSLFPFMSEKLKFFAVRSSIIAVVGDRSAAIGQKDG